MREFPYEYWHKQVPYMPFRCAFCRKKNTDLTRKNWRGILTDTQVLPKCPICRKESN